MQLFLSTLPSPLGELFLVTDEQERVRALDFEQNEARLHRLLHRHYKTYALVHAQGPIFITAALAQYFDGDYTALDTLTTATAGTDLQHRVWQTLRHIPVSQTTSYGALASALGLSPRAAIAIGTANGANPISIIVPCHRVIGSDGALRGYAGGLHRKRWLLEHEQALKAPYLQ